MKKIIETKMLKINDEVEVISDNIYPELIGKIGKVVIINTRDSEDIGVDFFCKISNLTHKLNGTLPNDTGRWFRENTLKLVNKNIKEGKKMKHKTFELGDRVKAHKIGDKWKHNNMISDGFEGVICIDNINNFTVEDDSGQQIVFDIDELTLIEKGNKTKYSLFFDNSSSASRISYNINWLINYAKNNIGSFSKSARIVEMITVYEIEKTIKINKINKTKKVIKNV